MFRTGFTGPGFAYRAQRNEGSSPSGLPMGLDGGCLWTEAASGPRQPLDRGCLWTEAASGPRLPLDRGCLWTEAASGQD
ncbi:unnamed protein product [Arctogadus glacialis]